ncbi:hypothetical protein TPDSL_17880 [Terrisporobacter petrolearius]|uniref:hypothetical protein n=1 Tax=Terrisporobacter petrolearius TaxID=1460447 RepID=UPI0033667520
MLAFYGTVSVERKGLDDFNKANKAINSMIEERILDLLNIKIVDNKIIYEVRESEVFGGANFIIEFLQNDNKNIFIIKSESERFYKFSNHYKYLQSSVLRTFKNKKK